MIGCRTWRRCRVVPAIVGDRGSQSLRPGAGQTRRYHRGAHAHAPDTHETWMRAPVENSEVLRGASTGVTVRVKVAAGERLLFGGGADGPLSTATTTMLTAHTQAPLGPSKLAMLILRAERACDAAVGTPWWL